MVMRASVREPGGASDGQSCQAATGGPLTTIYASGAKCGERSERNGVGASGYDADMSNPGSSTGRSAANRDLHVMWRVALGFVGVLLCFLSVALFTNPPVWSQHKAIGTANPSIDQGQADPSTFCIALLGVGVVMLLVAANGRKLLEVSSGGAKFDGPSEEQVSEDVGQSQKVQAKDEAQEPVAAASPDRTFERDGFEYQVFNPETIPAQVVADVAGARPEAVRTVSDIDYAFRRTGKGNHAWFIRTRRGLTLQVSYGGQGKSASTVKESEGG